MLQSLRRTLDLSDAEYQALLAVRDGLRAGELELDMRDGCKCIAGHMGARLGEAGMSGAAYTQKISFLPLRHPMRQLCYPPRAGWWATGVNGYDAKPAQAADAIDRVLVGADPWI